MPPVILMGGGGIGLGGSLYSIDCVTPSPIVEMPPSPAPNQMAFIEYPDDDFCIEVRNSSLKKNLLLFLIVFFFVT